MEINGTLMSKDTELAEIRDGHVVPVNETLLPLYIQSHDDFESWLGERAIDGHRTHSRLLKKALRLTTYTDPEIVLAVNAATITDTYWFRPQGSRLTYGDVRFKQNHYADLALSGVAHEAYSRDPESTPELTNIGSFEKAWCLIDGRWWLYKQGKPDELFSELFISKFGQKLGYPMAEYELDHGFIRSPDFTHGASVNFESAWGLVGEDEDYARSYEALARLSQKAADKFIAMIALDTICFNADRHTRNYGVLRDVDTGAVLDLAPNFDNNVALISLGYSKQSMIGKDLLVRLFIEFLKDKPEAATVYETQWRRDVTPDMVLGCIAQIPIQVDIQYVVDFINARADYLQNHIVPVISPEQDMEMQ